MSAPPTPPSAFISYSHDSETHKTWVRELAERLTRDGIRVVLDQWDLSVGDELTRFMERSLSECDYVILICTEAYANKANERAGGVGYEASMLSSLLITQAPVATDGESRLIPVLRQSRRPRVLPRFAGSRLYVDLSADAEASGYEVLLRALHGAPKYTRPPIGRNPFANPEGVSAAGAASQATLPERTRDLTRSLRAARTAGAAALVGRQQHFPHIAGGTADQRHDELMRVIGTHAEYLRLLLQAAQAGELSANRFAEEIEHVISPKGWSSSGPVRIVELPYAVGWAAHHLVGVALLEQGKAEQAVQCAREPIQVSPGTRHAVFEIGRLTGWPVHLGHSNEAWESLRRLPAQLQWISTDLGEADEYWVATVAHALALNFTEFLARVQNGPNFEVVRQDREHAPRIPLYFWNEDTDIQRRAFRMLLRDSTGLRAALGLLARIPNLRDRWQQWIRYQQSWVSIESHGAATGMAPHGDLIKLLLSESAP